jgi:hypothetical protein
LTLFCLGLIGIYLSKVFIEVKQRPYTIVREVFETNNPSSSLNERELNLPQLEEEQQPESDGRR